MRVDWPGLSALEVYHAGVKRARARCASLMVKQAGHRAHRGPQKAAEGGGRVFAPARRGWRQRGPGARQPFASLRMTVALDEGSRRARPRSLWTRGKHGFGSSCSRLSDSHNARARGLRPSRGAAMEWILNSYDRRTDRDGQNRFTTETAFIAAGQDLLRDVWRGFVSAILPDGTEIKDVGGFRAMIAASPVAAMGG